jgi:cell division septal protein FtsQ
MVETLEEQARRWVRRKRTFYTIVVIYLALCVLWFVIDMVTGTDDLWFY